MSEPKIENECPCGGSPARPNRDCERCNLVTEVDRLQDVQERMANELHRLREQNHQMLTRLLRVTEAFDLYGKVNTADIVDIKGFIDSIVPPLAPAERPTPTT